MGALSVRIDLALSASLLESQKSHRALHAFRVEPGINTLVWMHSQANRIIMYFGSGPLPIGRCFALQVRKVHQTAKDFR